MHVVVMLTSVTGDTNTSKSFPYWPQMDNTSVECGEVCIAVLYFVLYDFVLWNGVCSYCYCFPFVSCCSLSFVNLLPVSCVP